ncbi:hypothetical protein R5W23_006066 [Gemmata sp. JC673]|uniref:Uncharacterized protein n=1 Tax=Gemmata algarum TaxID=2975278 RepID=A0ABU5EUN7_9BACT|nr:hypothetical protein [Gemmata algarum]MDY3558890.1 hypothetical protein [Gemmata algarum]
MTDYDIQGPTRVCAVTGRELKPGEKYFAALTESAGTLVRTDYAPEAWPGLPAGAVAYWCGKVPAAGAKPRKPVVNDDLLLDCFDRLKGSADADGLNFRYVATLLLMRRKRFKFEDASRDASGRDVMIVRDARGGAVHHVVDPRLNDEQIAAVQTEVFRVLGWE